MRAATFIEILVDQIRDEVREELMQDSSAAVASADPAAAQEARALAHQASATELWLSLNLQKRVVPRRGYRTSPSSTVSKSPSTSLSHSQLRTAAPVPAASAAVKAELRGLAQTIPQILALEFFKREGALLGTQFSEGEFKSAFRKLALRLHPDRHINASAADQENYSQRFARLTEAADELAATLR